MDCVCNCVNYSWCWCKDGDLRRACTRPASNKTSPAAISSPTEESGDTRLKIGAVISRRYEAGDQVISRGTASCAGELQVNCLTGAVNHMKDDPHLWLILISMIAWPLTASLGEAAYHIGCPPHRAEGRPVKRSAGLARPSPSLSATGAGGQDSGAGPLRPGETRAGGGRDARCDPPAEASKPPSLESFVLVTFTKTRWAMRSLGQTFSSYCSPSLVSFPALRFSSLLLLLLLLLFLLFCRVSLASRSSHSFLIGNFPPGSVYRGSGFSLRSLFSLHHIPPTFGRFPWDVMILSLQL